MAEDYYETNGFGLSEFRKAREEKTFLEAYRLWCPSLAYAAQQVVKNHRGCVIDFGAGHSHYEDKLLFEGVKQALDQHAHRILLLPSEDLDQSVSLLRHRSIKNRKRNWVHDGKTPEQTCEEILKLSNI